MKASQVPEGRYETREAINAISTRFGWTHADWMQDWPLEVSEEIVIEDCLQEYNRLPDEDQKFLLMKAMLYALDEVNNESDFERYSDQVSRILKSDFDVHKSTIYYWTLHGSSYPEDEGFRITPLMRKIWKEI